MRSVHYMRNTSNWYVPDRRLKCARLYLQVLSAFAPLKQRLELALKHQNQMLSNDSGRHTKQRTRNDDEYGDEDDANAAQPQIKLKMDFSQFGAKQ